MKVETKNRRTNALFPLINKKAIKIRLNFASSVKQARSNQNH